MRLPPTEKARRGAPLAAVEKELPAASMAEKPDWWPDWDAVIWPEYAVNVCSTPIALAMAAHPRYSTAQLQELRIIRVSDGTVVYQDNSLRHVPLVSDDAISTREHQYTFKLNLGWQPHGSYEIRALFRLTINGVVTEKYVGAVFFFIQSDSACDVAPDALLMYSSFTSQAYNHFGGSSFYRPFAQTLPEGHSGIRRISLNRPLVRLAPYHTLAVMFEFEKLLRESNLEYNAIDSEYLHKCQMKAINKCRHLVIVGHDEYVTGTQRDVLLQYLENGGRMSIFGGNFCWWEAHYEPSRFLSVKNFRRDENSPADLDRWDSRGGRIELARHFGLSFHEGGYPVQRRITEDRLKKIGWTSEQYTKAAGMEVIDPNHPIFEGTGLLAGNTFGAQEGLMLVEIDGATERDSDNEIFPDRQQLARGWVVDGGGKLRNVATIAEVTFPSGGRLLHLGSIGWYRAIVKDPVCRKIAENVLRYQGTSL